MGSIAIFYPKDGTLKVFKDYGERAYMSQAIDAVTKRISLAGFTKCYFLLIISWM